MSLNIRVASTRNWLQVLSSAGDELLDVVGNDVLRLDVEYRVIGPRNLRESRSWNVLREVASASDRNQCIGDAMDNQSGGALMTGRT
jgi:hypothetical protein